MSGASASKFHNVEADPIRSIPSNKLFDFIGSEALDESSEELCGVHSFDEGIKSRCRYAGVA